MLIQNVKVTKNQDQTSIHQGNTCNGASQKETVNLQGGMGFDKEIIGVNNQATWRLTINFGDICNLTGCLHHMTYPSSKPGHPPP